MKKKSIIRISCLTALLLLIIAKGFNHTGAQDTGANDIPVKVAGKKFLVYKYDIKENIAPPVWRTTQKAFNMAKEMQADLILIHMNTYGGTVIHADSISKKILTSTIPVVVFIDNNAASAGAWISISCDSIYMAPGARIGAATVVNQTAEEMPDKYQSYMRSSMRATAETKGRDPDIAEAMVDEDKYIEGVSDSGKVLTFTTGDAIRHGFCEGEVANIKELMEKYGVDDYEIVEHRLTAMDKIIGFLISPAISGLLIMLIIGGIYFELQSPGIGFPLAAAMVGALLYFAPLYLEGLAANWEIMIFIAGFVLIAVEIFAIPGFGVAGISGIVLIITGLAFSMLDNVVFDFSHIEPMKIFGAFSIVMTSIFLAIIFSYIITDRIFGHKTVLFGQLSLNTNLDKTEGYTTSVATTAALVGKSGVAFTVLRPSGKVEIDDIVYDASAESGYIDKDQEVVVVKYATGQLVVRLKE
ncbi:MAG: NfeD family protein [Bacteroidales bacterium]|nr:NfeD family protein [Bacteroidales bacterium]